MRILVIEDYKLKAQDIRKSLEKQYPNVVIEESYAYASGVRKAYKEKYDAVIIDNSLPYYESEPHDIQPDMARIILDEFYDLEISPKSIICSAFEPGEKEEYFANIVSQFDFCLGYVRYDCTSSNWENELTSLINKNIIV